MDRSGLHVMASLTAAAMIAGCATSYVPRSPQRLSVVMQGGSLAYTRDGQTFTHGFAGSGLVDAVEGDPEATEAAETYYHRNIGGVVATVLGAACLAGGVTALAVRQPLSPERQALAGGTLLCGVAAVITGTALLMSARAYELDAVNIYNDHAELRLFAPRYAYPPPGGPPLVPARPPRGAARSASPRTPAPPPARPALPVRPPAPER